MEYGGDGVNEVIGTQEKENELLYDIYILIGYFFKIYKLDFNVQYTLDSKKSKDPRMFFLNQEGRHILNETIRLTKRKQHCTIQQVYLRVRKS